MGVELAVAIIGKIIIAGVLFVASSIISSALKKDAATTSSSSSETSTGHLVNTTDSQEPIPLIYGRVRVGINLAYVGTGGTDNKYLHLIGIIGEGPIEGVGQTGGVDQIFLDDTIYTDYGSLVHYEVFTGTPDQEVCATLHAAISEWNDPMRHTAYIYMRLEYDSDKFQSKPEITLEVEGLKVFNPVVSQWMYSANSALAALDYIIRPSTRGGVGFGYDRILESSITSCVAYTAAKGWTCNIPIGDDQACVDNLAQILATFRGCLTYQVNQFKLLYADLNYESSCLSIDEDDIVQDGKYSTLIPKQPTIFDSANAIRIKYLNKDNKYVLDDYVLADTDAIAQAKSYREETVTIKGIDNYANAMKMANYYLEKEMINKVINAQLHSRCCVLEAHDVFDVTHAARGWDAKLFRVSTVAIDEDMNVAIEATEEDEDFYNDTYDMASHTYYDTTLPRPSDPVPSVQSVSHAEEVYYYRERSFTRWKISFDGPSAEDYPWWDYAEIWIAIGAGDYVFMTKSRSDYVVDPVEEGETYTCKMVSVSIHGAKEAFATAYSVQKTIVGKTATPSNVTTLTGVASGDTVTLFADPVTDPDLEGYEVRLGTTWAGALFFGFTKAPYVRLTGVKTGTFTFWMAAKDNSGYYGNTPDSCTVTVLGPASYVDKNTWSWDFSTGTHKNTQKTTYGGNNVLGCQHAPITGDNLLTNGDFDADITSWSASGTESSIYDASGYVGGAMKVVAGGAYAGRYQNITVEAGKTYRLLLYYKNTASDVAAYKIYDASNSANIVANTDLANSTSYSAQQAIDFTAPAGCTSVGIYLLGKTSGDIVWFDSAEVYEKDASASLVGVWTSPEYDLGSKKKVRCFGDFIADFLSSALTWGSVFASGATWASAVPSGYIWADLLAVGNAGNLQATFCWGDTPGALTNSASFFQILAVEIEARYVQVVVTITDPQDDAYVYLRTLNMYAQYWS